MSVDEAKNIGDAGRDRETGEIVETPLAAFRRSAGFQFMFVLHSGLAIEKAIDHLCASAEKLSAAMREWQPIETCPDNTTVMFWDNELKIGRMEHDTLRMGGFKQDHFWGAPFNDDVPPTRWIVLPDPPCLSISDDQQLGQASKSESV